MYHYSGSNAAQWPGSYCWPEGFMRRFAQYGGGEVSLVMTPELILDMRNAAKTLITQIHIGREFDESGVVPRLGPDVPQWFGETIGFWDGDALITWTSNIQGWISHGGFEFSNKLQSIEIYTPRKDASGALVGLKQEIVLYDEEALAEPVRIVHNLDKQPRAQRGRPVRDHGVRAAELPRRRPHDADDAGADRRVPRARHLRPAVGADLGALSRGRHGAAARADGQVRAVIEWTTRG